MTTVWYGCLECRASREGHKQRSFNGSRPVTWHNWSIWIGIGQSLNSNKLMLITLLTKNTTNLMSALFRHIHHLVMTDSSSSVTSILPFYDETKRRNLMGIWWSNSIEVVYRGRWIHLHLSKKIEYISLFFSNILCYLSWDEYAPFVMCDERQYLAVTLVSH